MYYSVTVPCSQYRISNFNTDIEEYLNTKKQKENKNIKKKIIQLIVFLFVCLIVFVFVIAKHCYCKPKQIEKKPLIFVIVGELNRKIRDNVALFQRTFGNDLVLPNTYAITMTVVC